MYSKEHMLELLHDGILHFKYTKNGGEIRDAYGTLDTEYIPKKDQSTRSKKRTFSPYIIYYDIDSSGWRLFRPENVTYIDEDYGI